MYHSNNVVLFKRIYFYQNEIGQRDKSKEMKINEFYSFPLKRIHNFNLFNLNS